MIPALLPWLLPGTSTTGAVGCLLELGERYRFPSLTPLRSLGCALCQDGFDFNPVMRGAQSQSAAKSCMQISSNVLLVAFAVQSASCLDVLHQHLVLVLQSEAVDDLLAVGRASGHECVAVGVQSNIPCSTSGSAGAGVQIAGAFWDSMRARMTAARASFVGGV